MHYRSELTEEEQPQTTSKLEEEDEEMEGDDEDEEGSLTEKSQDETASPATMVQGTYDEDEEPPPLPMSYEHTRRSAEHICLFTGQELKQGNSHLNQHSNLQTMHNYNPTFLLFVKVTFFNSFKCNITVKKNKKTRKKNQSNQAIKQ